MWCILMFDVFVLFEIFFCLYVWDIVMCVLVMYLLLMLDKYLICCEVVIVFKCCYVENVLGKFFGKCNEEKWMFDVCLKE